MAEPSAHVMSCVNESTELDCRFLLEVEEMLAPQSVAQLLEGFQDNVLNGLEVLAPDSSSDQDCISSNSSGTPVNAFESESVSDSTVDAGVTKTKSCAPPSLTKTKQRAPRIRTHRKTELESLRSQVADLDKMLNDLQLKEMKATADGLADVLVGSIMPPAVRLVMQNAADPRSKSPLDSVYREQVDHIRAVLENLKLRSLFMEQLSIERGLGSVFRNQARGFVCFMILNLTN